VRTHILSTRFAAGLALAVLAGALVAGCQPLPHPFDEDRPAAALLVVPDSIGIAVGPFEGEPHAAAAKLPAAVAQQLLKHSIPASELTTSRASYRLDGRLEERPDQPGKSLVTVFWRLRDASGRIVNERSDRLSAPTRDWDGGSDERVTELAAAGAGALAALLTDETPKEQPGGGRTRVAIGKIAGAPGDGDDSLAASLNVRLKHQDIDLVDAAKGRPDLVVNADIKVDPPKDRKQHVKIVWRVARAGGGEVGQVAQENDVPAGQLSGPWGDIAYNVALSAEGGIMQLVARGAPPRKPGAEAAVAVAPGVPPAPAAPQGAAGAAPPPPAPARPPVAGNLAAPEVNLPDIKVSPMQGSLPAPVITQDAPVVIPNRGVPVPR
jgi:hypothetical protein